MKFGDNRGWKNVYVCHRQGWKPWIHQPCTPPRTAAIVHSVSPQAGTTITKPGFWATTPVSDGPNWAKSLAAAFLAAVVDDATAASQDARVGYCIPLLCRATSSNSTTLRPLLACEPSYEPPTSARLMVYTKRSLLARNCRSLAKTCHFKARISHFSLHLLLSHIG